MIVPGLCPESATLGRNNGAKLSDCYSKDVISGAGGGTVEDCGALGDASEAVWSFSAV